MQQEQHQQPAVNHIQEQTLKVGLEIHGYIDVNAKLFCDCAIKEDAQPNVHTCPVCTGQPGSKPMLTNKDALQKSVAIGLMLGCTINEELMFQRKHYSWPDSPNNYQRTMSGSYAVPVGENGAFEGIGIREVHLEEDPARWDPLTGKVDYNRAGHPLIEIVTDPDFTSSEQVREWLKKLITTLSYIKAINKTAGIKCDVNVSVAPDFERAEIKNVNSQTAIVEAIEYEARRQRIEKEQGRSIPLQTRAWDDAAKVTTLMRTKETAQDYMFIPDPDLVTIDIDQIYLDSIKATLPQPPSVKHKELLARGLSDEDARVLSAEYVLVDLFEQLTKSSSERTIDPHVAAMYLRREFVRVANYNKKDVDQLTCDTTQIHVLLEMVQKKAITDRVAQKILDKLLITPFDVKEYVTKEGLASVSDASAIDGFCKIAIDANPKAVADYKAGNEPALNFLVGQVMKQTRGAAKPDVVLARIKSLIN